MNNFYLPNLKEDLNTAQVTGDEARHMIDSKRLRPDDRVTLFDGFGLVAQGKIQTTQAQTVKVKIDKVDRLQPPTPKIVLASAVPKGERMSILLDMATQLGMTEFVPLQCQRSVIKNIDNKIDRYERICVSACKQSGQFYLPKIRSAITPVALMNCFDRCETEFIVADPCSKSRTFKFRTDARILVLIVGPEGGFSEQERHLFDHQQVNKIRLSKSILRIETAGVGLLAKINC